MSLGVKGDYFLKQCYEICPCNGDGLCSLWGTDWILKYSLDELRLQSYFYSSMKFSSSVVLIRWCYVCTYLSHVPSSYYEQVISSMFGEDFWLQLIILIITIYLWLLVAGNWLLFGVVSHKASRALRPFSGVLCSPVWVLMPWFSHPRCLVVPEHLAVKQKGGEKCPWILLTLHLNHATQGSFTCRKILRHGTSCFTSHPKEGVLRIFIAIKKFIALVAFEPASFGSSGKHTNHYATEATFRSDIWGISYLRNAPCNLQFHHYA
jgi:hypothetical protein